MSNPSRFPYGRARGFVNNFNYRSSTAGLIASTDATPDVTDGGLFYTNNASATTITYLDLLSYANKAADYEGKEVTLFFLDSNTSIANGGQMFLSGTANAFQATESITLMHSRSGWYEMQRSRVNRTDMGTVNVGGTVGLNVDFRRVIQLVATGGATNTVASISGGQVGQQTTIFNRSGGANVVINSAGNIFIGGTNAVTLLSNQYYSLLKVDSSQWILQRQNLFV